LDFRFWILDCRSLSPYDLFIHARGNDPVEADRPSDIFESAFTQAFQDEMTLDALCGGRPHKDLAASGLAGGGTATDKSGLGKKKRAGL
jgi:hypothetical protein